MSDLKPVNATETKDLEETLKRCPDGTLDALIQYRNEGDLDALSTFLVGCIKRHTDQEYQACLDSGDESISFIDDLGVDSMAMMEVVMMVEECLGIRLENKDLMQIQTIGDLNGYIKKQVA